MGGLLDRREEREVGRKGERLKTVRLANPVWNRRAQRLYFMPERNHPYEAFRFLRAVAIMNRLRLGTGVLMEDWAGTSREGGSEPSACARRV